MTILRNRVWLIQAVALSGLLSTMAMAAQGDDPDWPCIQRKVPELSLGQIWTGAQLPQIASEWERDAAVVSLVTEVAARRVPIAEAQQRIRDYAADLPSEERGTKLAQLAQGLFEQMNRERSDVIRGIGRYAHRQRQLAASLREESAVVDRLRGQPGSDPVELARRNDQLMLQTRIFQERVQSLSFVCEVPTLIEQRLYALVKVIAETLDNP